MKTLFVRKTKVSDFLTVNNLSGDCCWPDYGVSPGCEHKYIVPIVEMRIKFKLGEPSYDHSPSSSF